MKKKKAKEEFVKIKESLEPEIKPKRERRTKEEMIAERDTLVQEPNLLLIPILKAPFSLWAAREKIEELRLLDEEAYKLALPLTQITEYFFPGKIPAIIYACSSLVFTGISIMQPRMNKIKEVRIEREKSESNPGETRVGKKLADKDPSAKK